MDASAPDADLVARLRLTSTPGLSPRVLRRLVDRFGSPEAVLRADEGAIARVNGLGRARAGLVTGATAPAVVLRDLDRMRRADVRVLRPPAPGWPAGLEELDDPPLVLFSRGEVTGADARAVAIVGSRRASRYGLRCAHVLAAELAELGFTIVSGLARGIDTQAHRGALAAGGRTIAVLGGGLARLYPPENLSLARDVAAGSGAVLSEFPLDLAPRPYHFPRRNRIMAAMALAVVVVEATERSGSLITVDHALDIGREVLAVPGRIDSKVSRGTHRILREGAALCEGAADVLAALGIESEDGDGSSASAEEVGRTPEERAVLAALEGDERHADEIVEDAGLDPGDALAALSALELRGAVRLGPDGRYGRGDTGRGDTRN
jgi:DNA processing protein